MYSAFVRDTIESAKNYYNYAATNKTSRIIVNVTRISQISKDTYALTLAQKLNRPDTVCLSIKSYLIEPEWYAEKGEAYIDPNLFEIIQNDNFIPSVKIKVKPPLSEIFDNLDRSEITIVSDLKFLIKRVENWYADYGEKISLPPEPFVTEDEIYFKGDHAKNKKAKETREQKEAVKTALSKNISYIWGAPGTGKTQYVLADCLLTYIKRGDRVVVLAPTHNAIEQTLSAVIKAMEEQGEDITCIYRLGIPTASFAAKYPMLCERVDHNATLELLRNEIEALNAQIFEQQEADRVTKNYSAFASIYIRIQDTSPQLAEISQSFEKLSAEIAELNDELTEIKISVSDNQNALRLFRQRESAFGFKFKSLFSQKESLEIAEKKQYANKCIDSLNLQKRTLEHRLDDVKRKFSQADDEKRTIINKQTELSENAKDIVIQTFGGFYYKTLSEANIHFQKSAQKAKKVIKDPHIYERLKEKEREYNELSESNAKIMSTKQVFAFTVDYFFSHYKQLTTQDLGIVSHVFLDEAAYCPLIKSGILYSLNAPVTLLGDHMQLMPICEAGKEATNRIETKIFLWEQSAIYFPQVFDNNSSLEALFERFYMIHNADDIKKVKYYSEDNMTTAVLPKTHRFGDNLAHILDQFVYNTKFHGTPNGYTQTYFLHAKRIPSEAGNRLSSGEVEAIRDLIIREKYTDCVVMTPYKKQRDMLQKHIGSLIGAENILTVHASQGREWETVILSVVDSTERDMFFTDSSIPQGLHTINTAISRVKKNLIIVCDTDFWKKKGSSQLIGAIITDPETQDAELPAQGYIKISWTKKTMDMYSMGIKDGRLKAALNEQNSIYSRFISNIKIHENKAPYVSVSISSATDKRQDTYETTLFSCTCKDYRRNLSQNTPCKHIFALALKVKLINSDGTFNRTISIPSTNVDIIE